VKRVNLLALHEVQKFTVRSVYVTAMETFSYEISKRDVALPPLARLTAATEFRKRTPNTLLSDSYMSATIKTGACIRQALLLKLSYKLRVVIASVVKCGCCDLKCRKCLVL